MNHSGCPPKGPIEKGKHSRVHAGADRGRKGIAEEMGKNQLVNPPGILDGMEMGAFVLLNIHGADANLFIGDAHGLHSQQHIGFVLEPVAVNRQEFFNRVPGNRPQTGLGIGQSHAAKELEDQRGGVIAEPASGRHLGAGEIPAAQHHIPGFQHPLAAGSGILRVVLIVSVHGDNTQALGPIFQEPGKGRFQCRALSPVHLMVQQGNLFMLLRRVLETGQVFRLGAVIHQNDVRKTIFQEAVDYGIQLFVRVQRGQNHGNLRKIQHRYASFFEFLDDSMVISRYYSIFLSFCKVLSQSLRNISVFRRFLLFSP